MDLFPRNTAAKFRPSLDMRSVPIWMKLLIALVPCTMILLIAAGLTGDRLSGRVLDDAAGKNVQIRATALANEVGVFLSNRREDLLMLGYKQITPAGLYDFWKSRQKVYGWGYEAVAYLTTDPEQCIYLVSRGKDAVMISTGDIQQVRPDPRNDVSEIPRPEDGILVTSVVETSYPVTDAEKLSPLPGQERYSVHEPGYKGWSTRWIAPYRGRCLSDQGHPRKILSRHVQSQYLRK